MLELADRSPVRQYVNALLLHWAATGKRSIFIGPQSALPSIDNRPPPDYESIYCRLRIFCDGVARPEDAPVKVPVPLGRQQLAVMGEFDDRERAARVRLVPVES